ncbi:MAG: hypothetical protein BGN88_06815 [Clostridiales bacterium 43-6]|nr:MAG: hypothetical protein BGN88_06815 [Clostridiales bacterium 43-6]
MVKAAGCIQAYASVTTCTGRIGRMVSNKINHPIQKQSRPWATLSVIKITQDKQTNNDIIFAFFIIIS